jgi:hypothetical protein
MVNQKSRLGSLSWEPVASGDGRRIPFRMVAVAQAGINPDPVGGPEACPLPLRECAPTREDESYE